ncbi:16844_t:CDS:1, partial [Racocetra fulgida]
LNRDTYNCVPLINDKIKPEKVIGEAFDLVCNGEELLSGSLRIYQRDLQEKVLEILGYRRQHIVVDL